MPKKLNRYYYWMLPTLGLASLLTQFSYLNILFAVMIPLCLAIPALSRIPGTRRIHGYYQAMGLGIFVWPARLFYWDAVEFSKRVNFLALLICVLMLFRFLARSKRLRGWILAFHRLPLRRRLVSIYLISWVLLGAGAAIMTQKGIPLLGDEPHYLVLAQSIARDGDLNVANQYGERQYRQYLPEANMGIHGYFGWRDARFEARRFRPHLPPPSGKYIYSIHLPGLALTLAPLARIPMNPVWWVFMSRLWMALFGAGIPLMVYLFALRLMKNRFRAIQVAMIILFTPPIFFHSIHLYPESQVLLIILAALYLLLYGEKRRRRNILIAGFLLSLLFFWGVKYAVFTWGFVAGFAFVFLRKRDLNSTFRLILFPILGQLLLFAFLYHAYGNFSPMSVYMNYSQKQNFSNVVFNLIPHSLRLETLLDYFLDQRDGLLPYAPLFFFAFPGLILALRRWRKYVVHLLLALPAAFFVFNYAFLSHRGGQSPQARPLVPVIWILLVFVMVYLKEGRNEWMRRVAWRWLPLYGVGVTLFQISAPWTLYQPTTHNIPLRPGLLFQLWSPLGLRIDSLLPSFAKVPGNWSWWPNIFWIGFLLLLIALALIPMRRGLRAGRVTVALFLAALLTIAVILPRIPDYNPTLVAGPDMIPHRFMGASHSPRRVEHREFMLEPKSSYEFTLVTLKPVRQLKMFWRGGGSAPFTLKLFDRTAKTGNGVEWKLEDPEYRKRGMRHYYRLHMIPAEVPGSVGMFEIQPH